MKKFFILVLVLILLFTTSGGSFALKSGVSEFSITPIRADQKDKYIKINITAPQTIANSKMLVGFYVDGKLTKLTPLDISSTKTFTNKQIDTSVLVKDPEGNYYKDLTPDTIKIFTWDKNSLAPKTLCNNVLTPKVIKDANKDVVASLSIVPEATQHIRNNFLTWPEDVEDGLATEWDEHLFRIMDYIDACAIGALEDSEEHLLTSLFAQNRYKAELSNIRTLYSETTVAEKEKMKEILSGSLDPTDFPTEYYDALNNSMKFLDFSLTEI